MGEKGEILACGGNGFASGGYGPAWRNSDQVGTAIGRRDAAIFLRSRGAKAKRCGKVLLKDCHGEILEALDRGRGLRFCLLYRRLDGYGGDFVVLNFEGGPESLPCYIERLGKYTSFCGDGHKICVSEPAGQNVHVDMVSDAGARGFAKVEAHVEAARAVNLTQDEFGTLGEEHQLVGRVCWHGGERGEVLIGHDHEVAGGVGIGVETDEAVLAAMDDVDGLFGGFARHAVGNGVVDGSDHVAKDAVSVFVIGRRPGVQRGGDAGAGLRVCAGDVAIAPGSPEAIHWPSIAVRAEAGRDQRPEKQINFAAMVPEVVLCIQS